MAHLIDGDALLAEIDRRICTHIVMQRKPEMSDLQEELQSKIDCLKSLKGFINNTLEVKEINLKEEIDKIWKPRFSLGWDDKSLLSISYKGFETFAEHFFELGLKAKDWEKERMEECPYRQVGCTMYEGKILECRGACSWVVDYPKLKKLREE